MSAWVYILQCADGKYYVGSARGSLERRVLQPQHGVYDGFTKGRRPVTLVYSESFARVDDAVAAERRLKKWSRAKKQALMDGDLARLKALSKRRKRASSFDAAPASPAQDEEGVWQP